MLLFMVPPSNNNSKYSNKGKTKETSWFGSSLYEEDILM